MPVIELELSDKVFAKWRSFLGGEAAGRLLEAKMLGDWCALSLMAHVHDYLEDGGPPVGPQKDEETRQELESAAARKKLSKLQKRVLPMFNENDRVTVEEISRVLGMLPEEGGTHVSSWLAEGFLATGPKEDRGQTYILSEDWQRRNLAANRPSLNVPRTVEDMMQKQTRKKH